MQQWMEASFHHVLRIRHSPTSIGRWKALFTRMAEGQGGAGGLFPPPQGPGQWDSFWEVNGVDYRCWFVDYLKFRLEKIME